MCGGGGTRVASACSWGGGLLHRSMAAPMDDQGGQPCVMTRQGSFGAFVFIVDQDHFRQDDSQAPLVSYIYRCRHVVTVRSDDWEDANHDINAFLSQPLRWIRRHFLYHDDHGRRYPINPARSNRPPFFAVEPCCVVPSSYDCDWQHGRAAEVEVVEVE